jgi:hypothetical protein
MNSLILGLAAYISVTLTPYSVPVVKSVVVEKSLNLNERTPSPAINEGFSDNMLLSLHYMNNDISDPKNIDWNKIRQPFEVSFTLNPGEVYAFHNNVLDQYKNPKITMNSRFMTYEGYRYVAGLGGNGVCHLASLITWAAKSADLEVTALARHDFYPVRGVPREFGTAIMSQSATQNLYIRNNKDIPITFVFKADPAMIDLIIAK